MIKTRHHTMKKTHQHYIDNMSSLGVILYYMGGIRIYRDGDATGFVWRWWNPLWIICLPMLVILSVLLDGAVKTFKDKHYLGVCVSPFFKENPEKLEWL